jgi:hypothetical protein
MPVAITVTKGKSTRVRLGLALEFSADDPQAAHIYHGLALFIREALTVEEAAEFLAELKAEGARVGLKATGEEE